MLLKLPHNLIWWYFENMHISWTEYKIDEWKTNLMSLVVLFHLLCPQHVSDISILSSGACDCVDELPHRSSCSQFVVFWICWCSWFLVVSFCRLKHNKLCFSLQNEHHTKPATQRTENKTTDVVIHQHSRKLLMMDILMSETCWAHKKWNKIASDIKLVFHSSTRETNRSYTPVLDFILW